MSDPQLSPGLSGTHRSGRAHHTGRGLVPSLMWPEGHMPAAATPAAWAADLGLDDLARALSDDGRYFPFIRNTLAALCVDPAVITWRQAVLADFRRNPDMAAGLEALLPALADLRQNHALLGGQRRSVLLETADRLAELDLYLDVVQRLGAVLGAANLSAPALRGLRDHLVATIADPEFQALREELPALRAPLQNLASLTIGINLDLQLQPISAVLLAINDHPVGEARSFLDRLLGPRAVAEDESGIAPLHFTPENPDHRPLSPLFQDLEKIIAQTAQPVIRALNRYVRVSSAPLAPLEHEVAFYTSATAFIQRLEARGVPFCAPRIAPISARISQIAGLHNVMLCVRQPELPVANDVQFNSEGRIAVLTGPNSGGKTTYVQAVGLAQVLFQAGLWVPARAAEISPVDAIFTHFPQLETQQQGRLAEEAARLRSIFLAASAHSLVLMNETLSSTTASEALYLAQDLLAALRAIGVRAIYATHLIELAEHIAEIEASIPGESRVYSLVAGVAFDGDGQARPTFQIARGMPLGRGYAQEIARRHGISLSQILEARGVRSLTDGTGGDT